MNTEKKLKEYLEKIKKEEEFISKHFPSSKFSLDEKIYSKFNILKLNININNRDIQPMLFGDLNDLARLNKHFWELGSEEWSNKMESFSNRGTFLKRGILIPKLIEECRKYVKKDSNVIELGIGEGVIFRELKKLTSDVSGLDLSSKFIDKLKKEFPLNNFYAEDVVEMDFSKRFSMVICSMLLLDIPQIDLALSKIFSILEPQGILIIVDINSNVYKALGYYEGNNLVKVHNSEIIFHTEKIISGHTKAVHNYHPFNYYRDSLTLKGFYVLEDYVFGPTKKLVFENKNLNESEKENLTRELVKDINNPPFHMIVMRK